MAGAALVIRFAPAAELAAAIRSVRETLLVARLRAALVAAAFVVAIPVP